MKRVRADAPAGAPADGLTDGRIDADDGPIDAADRPIDAVGGLASSPPPWLWLALVMYLYELPSTAAWWHEQVTWLWTSEVFGPEVVGGAAFAALRVTTISQAMPTVIVPAGLATVLLPHIRGRWTERRHALVDTRGDDLPVAAGTAREIQELLDRYAPGAVLMVSLSGGGPPIRVYARGWRERRVAASLGYIAMWHSHPRRARALLAHEAAHLTRGEHLITGLGSPFTTMVKAWPVVFLAFGVGPLIWLAMAHHPSGSLMGAQVLTVMVKLPHMLIVPVAALWCVELAADRYAVDATGRRTVAEALHAAHERESRLRRAGSVLHHPPRWLRRWFIAGAHRPSARLLLLTAGPLALLVQAVVVTAFAVPSLILVGDPAPNAVASSLDLAHRNLLPVPLWTTIVVILLVWPAVEGFWLRLWGAPRHSGKPRPSEPVPSGEPGHAGKPAPSGVRRPRLHLVAALLPASVLVVALLPHSGALERDPVLRPSTASAAQSNDSQTSGP
ncbi:hypothetical protein ACFWU3_03395 [Streptomyces sp. NPDC058685]|uniref:hypothetical protein n=1 Tax=Streptomyces sp. NPDC058685 TaxID=3346598 RepID=UPI003654873D